VEIKLTPFTYRLTFKRAFGIAHGTRTGTDSLFIRATTGDKEGYGEAALPPYLGYDVHQLISDFNSYFPTTIFSMEELIALLQKVSSPISDIPSPLRCAMDIALHDLCGQLANMPARKILEVTAANNVRCSVTLGISSVEEMIEKIKEVTTDSNLGFTLFKHKLGGENDLERIKAFKDFTNADFCIDANQAWKSVEEATKQIHFLQDLGCLFVEQPMPVSMNNHLRELKKNIQLPIILDESIQSISDFDLLKNDCDGINVKLMKCGGMAAGKNLIQLAKRHGKKILIGCMSESTCGAAAAAELAGLADWVDLDGPLLISNDPFEGITYQQGCILPNTSNGVGIRKITDLTFSA
jgi:L-alanine-DL-glutamate epimerase-like enolase superfamily enzyme